MGEARDDGGEREERGEVEEKGKGWRGLRQSGGPIGKQKKGGREDYEVVDREVRRDEHGGKQQDRETQGQRSAAAPAENGRH